MKSEIKIIFLRHIYKLKKNLPLKRKIRSASCSRNTVKKSMHYNEKTSYFNPDTQLKSKNCLTFFYTTLIANDFTPASWFYEVFAFSDEGLHEDNSELSNLELLFLLDSVQSVFVLNFPIATTFIVTYPGHSTFQKHQ